MTKAQKKIVLERLPGTINHRWGLSTQEQASATEWMLEHVEKHMITPKMSRPYWYFKFLSGSISTDVTVGCQVCKEAKSVTDYSVYNF